MKGKTRIYICCMFLFSFHCYSNELDYYAILGSDILEGESEKLFRKYFMDGPPYIQLSNLSDFIAVAEKQNNYFWLSTAYYGKGNSYLQIGNHEEAVNCYLKSIDIAQKNKLSISLGKIYFAIANSLSMGKYSQRAIDYYHKSIYSFKENGNIVYEGYTILNLIDEYIKIKQYDSCKFYLPIADSIFQSCKDEVGQAYVYGNRGLINARMGDFESAIDNIQEAITILNEYEKFYDKIAFQNELAKIFYQKKQYNLAQQYALKSYNKAFEAGLKEQIRDAAKLLADIYEYKGDYKHSYNYLKTYLAYNDSIGNEEVVRKMADLRAEYEISQKQVEVDLLQKKRVVNRLSLFAVTSVTLLLLVVAYILYRNNKFRMKLNILLNKYRLGVLDQNRELAEINATKDKMFSIVSHDLRGPIHSLAGILDLMKDMLQENNTAGLLRMVDSVRKSMSTVGGLLDNLLEWSASQLHSVPYNPELVNVSEIIVELFEIFEYAATAKSISLHNGLSSPSMAYVDRNTISTVFRNLINNAIKFTPDNGAVIVTGQQEESYVVIKVSDTGVGISPDRIKNIFEFSSAKSTYGTSNEKGIGLGLRLVLEFVQLNKSEIGVESREGKGTTFSVRLPESPWSAGEDRQGAIEA